MPKRFRVQTDYDAKDNTTGVQKKISRGFGKFAAGMADGNSRISRSFGAVNKSINRVAMIGMVALAGGVALAAREFVAFDQAVVGANARFKDFDIKEPTKNLQALKDAAREVGSETQFAATEAGQGLNFYAKAGFTSAEAMAVLADTVNLATVAEADFNRTADISSDLLGALGKNVQDSAKKIENLKEINRALGITANSANVDLEDLFETLKVAGPVATAAGESMNELFAITGALGGSGIKGSMGATALKNAYIRLAAPTDKVTAALDRLGLSQKDFVNADGDMKSMVNIMKQLGDASAGLGKAEQLGIFAEIFGKNAVAGATNLSKSLSEVEFILAKLESDTALKDLADEIRKGLGMQIQILKSGLIELGFQFVEAFEKDGRGALQGMIDFIQQVDIGPLIDFSRILVTIFTFIGKHWRLLISLAAGVKGVAIAMGILSIAFNVFDLVLKASTIGIIIAAVAVLTAAIVWAILNWDKIVAVLKIVWMWYKKIWKIMIDGVVFAFKTLVNWIKIAVKWIAETGTKFSLILGPIGLLISGLIEIAKQWDNIKTAFQEKGFLGGILAVGKALIAGVLAPIQGLLELASKIPGIGNLAAGGAERIQKLRDGLTAGPEIGTPQTPIPFNGSLGSTNGTVDINITGARENGEVSQSGTIPTGTNINFKPAIGL